MVPSVARWTPGKALDRASRGDGVDVQVGLPGFWLGRDLFKGKPKAKNHELILLLLCFFWGGEFLSFLLWGVA